MIRSAWLSLILFGLVIGASAMYSVMYNEPLTDYSYEGIRSYTSILYGLGDSIFSSLTSSLMIQGKAFIELITTIISVISAIFGWLANQLGNLINGLVVWLESLGIDLSVQEPPAGCVYINGRLECF
jgi:hypothetical protein